MLVYYAGTCHLQQCSPTINGTFTKTKRKAEVNDIIEREKTVSQLSKTFSQKMENGAG